MRRICVYWLLIALSCSTVWAESTKLKVTGSKQAKEDQAVEVKVDELVTLKVDTEPNAQVVIFVVPEMQYSRNRLGSEISFYAKQGKYTFCFAAFVSGKEPSKAQYTVVAGKDPGPDPGPDPDPTPPDPTPEPTGFAKKVYDIAMKVESNSRKSEAKKLAEVLRSVASKAAAVSSVTLNDMKMDMATGFKDALTDKEKAKWSDWSKSFANLLKEVANTKENAIKACNAAATGLEAVK